MTSDEMAGRLIVMEVMVMTSLGLYLANSRNDPDYSKAGALLEHMRQSVLTSRFQSPGEQAVAVRYVDDLITQLTATLRSLRGEGGSPH